MADVEQLVGAARDLTDAVLRLARRLLDAGVQPERVHRRYVAAALELREEVETRSVLASAGDKDAFARLALLVQQLRRLREEAKEELDQADGDGGI